MNHSKALFFGLLCLLFGILTGCHHNDEPDPTPSKKAGTHTVLVYLVADNSMSPFVKEDIAEMKKGFADSSIDTDKHNLLIYVDSYSDNPTIYRLKRDATGIVTDEIVYEYPADHDSCSPSVIQDVIAKAKEAYQAEKYSFIYWSHGDGWATYPLPVKSVKPMAGTEMKWIGIDVTRTEIKDLASALRSAYVQKLDFLMFDACFMLSVETVYELRNAADYVISSPAEIPGPGAPYDVIVPKMFGSNAALDVTRGYYNYYAAKYDETVENYNVNWTGGVCIGAAKTSEIEQLASATKRALASAQRVSLDELKNTVLNYDRRSLTSSGYIGYYDLCGMMEQQLSTSEYATWKKAYDAAVPVYLTTPKIYTAFSGGGLFSVAAGKGLSTYIPYRDIFELGDMDLSYRNTAWYKDAGLSQLGW